MTLFIIAFVAGMLTVLAPCVLPVLPVILGTVASSRSVWTPAVVIGSLCVSILIFTLLLKATTLFIVIPQHVWEYLSGAIVAFFGLALLFPFLWQRVRILNRVSDTAERFLGNGKAQHSFIGDVLVGASLGPIFSTCSPTYFVILGTVLPLNFLLGTLYVGVYTFGLAIALLLIALTGSRIMKRLSVFANPNGGFKKVLGICFIVLGVLIALGILKQIEVWVLTYLPFDVTAIEYLLLDRFLYE